MKSIKNIIFIFLSIMVIYGCEKEAENHHVTSQEEYTFENRNHISDFNVKGYTTEDCCITIEILSFQNFGIQPDGDNLAFYGYNATTNTIEKLYFADVDWV